MLNSYVTFKKVSFFYGGLLKTLAQTCRENTRTLPFWERGYPTESFVLPERGRVALKRMLTYDHVVLCFKNLWLSWFYELLRDFQGNTSTNTKI